MQEIKWLFWRIKLSSNTLHLEDELIIVVQHVARDVVR